MGGESGGRRGLPAAPLAKERLASFRQARTGLALERKSVDFLALADEHRQNADSPCDLRAVTWYAAARRRQ